MTTTSARLTIFEGPDGSGKTTLAKGYASMTGARYVHCGPFLGVTHGLARLYVEAMLPALLGYQDVVLDRCWLSEPIYGSVFRGDTRLGLEALLMLERVAARCQTRLVLALPKVEVCLKTFKGRPKQEYLQKASQLKEVHRLYTKLGRVGHVSLPTALYDYTKHGTPARAMALIEEVQATAPHPLVVPSAGYLDAKHVVVGEAFADQKEHDTLYQVPFVSFSNLGCSTWLTAHLALNGVSERQLLWANADHPSLSNLLMRYPRRAVYALGDKAAAALKDPCLRNALELVKLPHPQFSKRFNHKKPYPLITAIKERS